MPLALLETTDEAVTKEFPDTNRIEFETVLERGVTDLAIAITEDLRVLAAQCYEFVQHLASAPHLLYRVRAQ